MKVVSGTHVEDGVPNIMINIFETFYYDFGYLICFFEKPCTMNGYLLEVNPFDQSWLELYKESMVRLLKKIVCQYKKKNKQVIIKLKFV